MTESVIQTFLCSVEKCCGGENDAVKFRSESQTMMAVLLFALKHKHTHAMTPAPLIWCLPECETTNTSEPFLVCACVITPVSQVVFLTKGTKAAMR